MEVNRSDTNRFTREQLLSRLNAIGKLTIINIINSCLTLKICVRVVKRLCLLSSNQSPKSIMSGTILCDTFTTLTKEHQNKFRIVGNIDMHRYIYFICRSIVKCDFKKHFLSETTTKDKRQKKKIIFIIVFQTYNNHFDRFY